LKRSWKYYDHTLRKKRFLCTVTTFLSTVWNAHGVQREPTQIFISWESRGSTDPISPIFVENNMRSACIIHVFKIQSCKVQIQNYPKCFVSGQGKLYYILRKSGAANVFRSRSKHHSTFFKYKMFKEMVMRYNLRKSGAANFSRTVFLNLFWIKYRPWKHQVMIICWKNKDFKQQLLPWTNFEIISCNTPNHILIKSANHTFSPIAWIWGHVVNTCLLHFQVCGWSSGRKTHFETFLR
jgi:hypothetical protein